MGLDTLGSYAMMMRLSELRVRFTFMFLLRPRHSVLCVVLSATKQSSDICLTVMSSCIKP
jgi:hypothetical protein